MLLEVLITGIGSGIAKGVINIWLEDYTIEKEIAKNFAGMFASKTKDVIAQRVGNRQFETISEKVADNLLPTFAAYDEIILLDRQKEIAELAGHAIHFTQLSPEILINNNLEPSKVQQLLLAFADFPNEENPRINFTLQEEELYQRVMSEAAQYMTEIAGLLPNFTEKSFAEVLKREDAILKLATQILEEVRRIQENNKSGDEKAKKYESDYRRAVTRKLDKLQLFGVDLNDTSRRYKLSTAYVSLSVEYQSQQTSSADEEDSYDLIENLSIDEALQKSNRLLLRGPAGSGKTTLMQWVAVMSASLAMEGELAAWNQCIPFFIRLREFSDKELPTPKQFTALISKVIDDTKPENWTIEQLQEGRGIILVDGVDEIVEEKRETIKEWIKEIDELYPNNKWVVTSRPYAAKSAWLADFGFMDADLQEMGSRDIELFVEHWHEAVKESFQQKEVEELEQLDELSSLLKNTIKSNRNLRKLATSPLLCAMICALHRDRSTKLPSGRVELYEACINMFFRRDVERKISMEDYIELEDPDKRILLADLAYWLIRNNWSEVEVEKADERLEKRAKGLKNIPSNTSGTSIRRYFVERSGILRQPTIQTLDFPHRTFEEYLAAKATIEEGDTGVLITNSTNDQWREVIQLACGLARTNEANEIIQKLLEKGDQNKKERAYLHLLAVGCMDITREVETATINEVQKRLKKLVPPKKVSESKLLATVGEMVLPYLKYKQQLKANEQVAIIRTLALIGTENALEILMEFDNKRNYFNTVRDALLDGIKYCPDRDLFVDKVILSHKNLIIDRNMPQEILKVLPNLYSVKLSSGITGKYYLFEVLKYSNIKRLDLSEYGGRHKIWMYYNLLINQLDNIISLEIDNYPRVSELLPLFNSLKELRMNVYYSDGIDFYIMKQLKNLEILRIYNYSNNKMENSKMLLEFPSLKRVILFNKKIDNAIIRKLKKKGVVVFNY